MNWFDSLPLAEVVSRIYVGSAAQAEMLPFAPAALVVGGARITAVLNINEEVERHQAKEIVYKHIPFPDGEAIPALKLAQCFDWLGYTYESTAHNILIHCLAGISRSVTVAAGFIHYMGLMDFDLALSRIKRIRQSSLDPNVNVISSVKQMLGIWPYNSSLVIASNKQEEFNELLKRLKAERNG